jgi:hypothetical protein
VTHQYRRIPNAFHQPRVGLYYGPSRQLTSLTWVNVFEATRENQEQINQFQPADVATVDDFPFCLVNSSGINGSLIQVLGSIRLTMTFAT